VETDATAQPANPVRPAVDAEALRAALDVYVAGGGPPALSAGAATTVIRPTLVESKPFPEPIREAFVAPAPDHGPEPEPEPEPVVSPEPEPHLFEERDEPAEEVASAFVLPYPSQVADVDFMEDEPVWDRRRRALTGALALLLVLAGVIAVRNPFAAETSVDTTVPPAIATTLRTRPVAPSASTPRATTVAPPVIATVTTTEAPTEPPSPGTASPKTTAAPKPHPTSPPATAPPDTDPVVTEPPPTDPATTVPDTTTPPTDPDPTSEPPTSSPPPTEPPTTVPASSP
jgi:hypothetical protein